MRLKIQNREKEIRISLEFPTKIKRKKWIVKNLTGIKYIVYEKIKTRLRIFQFTN